MRDIVIIAHDMRSALNVGALLRTAECLGVTHVYFTGYTPYPESADDDRLPHIRAKLSRQIEKTALGTASLVPWSHKPDVAALLNTLHVKGYTVAALEQSHGSIALPDWNAPEKVAVVLGREVEGVATELLELCDSIIEIPQFGIKESLNVIQAAAIMIYALQIPTR